MAAREAITEAARRGTLSAMLMLGDFLQKSEPRTAFNWFSAAAAQGNAEAMMQAGVMASRGNGTAPDVKQAFAWFQGASEAGNVAGMRNLAVCYLTGQGVAKDVPRGVELLQKAIAMNDPWAMDMLAHRYQKADGVAQDFPQALKLFTQAADLGYLDSLGNLGAMMANGDGLPAPDRKRAFALFDQGAKKGNAYCMFLLARCYEAGVSVPVDAEQAALWYQRSAALGNARAVEWCRTHAVAFAPAGQ